MKSSLYPTSAAEDGDDPSAPSNGARAKSITAIDRIWATAILSVHVRAAGLLAPGLELPLASRRSLLALVIGAVVVAELALRWFGPGVVDPLGESVVGGFLTLISVGVVGAWIGLPESRPAAGATFLLSSVAIAAYRFRGRRDESEER